MVMVVPARLASLLHTIAHSPPDLVPSSKTAQMVRASGDVAPFKADAWANPQRSSTQVILFSRQC